VYAPAEQLSFVHDVKLVISHGIARQLNEPNRSCPARRGRRPQYELSGQPLTKHRLLPSPGIALLDLQLYFSFAEACNFVPVAYLLVYFVEKYAGVAFVCNRIGSGTRRK
jgi:hypothetical protein